MCVCVCAISTDALKQYGEAMGAVEFLYNYILRVSGNLVPRPYFYIKVTGAKKISLP